jgi:type 1 glutamine amidotransferase
VGHVHPHGFEHHFEGAEEDDGSAASGGPNLSNVDAIFFMGHREVPLEPSQREELLQFVREGKGFVAAHVGLTAFESWPEFLDLIGARFDGHPITGPGVVVNERPDFPATKHFPASFAFNDEFYQPKEHSRDKIDVMLRLDLSTVPASDSLHLKGDYPLAWAKMYGKGRVFYGSFAHSSETWDVRNIQQMYFEAMRWALGLSDAELKPHAMTPAPPAPAGRGGGPAVKSRLACCSSTRFASMPGIRGDLLPRFERPSFGPDLHDLVGGFRRDVEGFRHNFGGHVIDLHPLAETPHSGRSRPFRSPCR